MEQIGFPAGRQQVIVAGRDLVDQIQRLRAVPVPVFARGHLVQVQPRAVFSHEFLEQRVQIVDLAHPGTASHSGLTGKHVALRRAHQVAALGHGRQIVVDQL